MAMRMGGRGSRLEGVDEAAFSQGMGELPQARCGLRAFPVPFPVIPCSASNRGRQVTDFAGMLAITGNGNFFAPFCWYAAAIKPCRFKVLHGASLLTRNRE